MALVPDFGPEIDQQIGRIEASECGRKRFDEKARGRRRRNIALE